MQALFRCPRGHQWEAVAVQPTDTACVPYCPVCGDGGTRVVLYSDPVRHLSPTLAAVAGATAPPGHSEPPPDATRAAEPSPATPAPQATVALPGPAEHTSAGEGTVAWCGDG